MKKTIKKCAFIMALVIVAAIYMLSGTVLANEPEADILADDVIEDPGTHDSSPVTMHDINEVGQPEVSAWLSMLNQWEMDGYPDDIGGVYYDSATNANGILVVNPTPQRLAELRELFGDSVTITPGKYSYNELLLVQNEISEMMFANQDGGIYSSGMGWTRIDGIVQGFGESGKEFRVVVSVDESVFEHYNTGFLSRYGERVYVEVGSMIIATDDIGDDGLTGVDTTVSINASIIPIEITGVFSGGIDAGSNNTLNSSYWLWPIVGFVLLGILILFIKQRLRRPVAMQTTNGNIITGNTTLTKKQVTAAVKNSEGVPGNGLLRTIMQRIDEEVL